METVSVSVSGGLVAGGRGGAGRGVGRKEVADGLRRYLNWTASPAAGLAGWLVLAQLWPGLCLLMSKTALFHRRPSVERPLSFSLCLVRGSGVIDDDDDDGGWWWRWWENDERDYMY